MTTNAKAAARPKAPNYSFGGPGRGRKPKPERQRKTIKSATDPKGRRGGNGSGRPTGGTNKERDYSDDEREFILAMERYKKVARRPFPTWSEALAVAKELGYRRVGQADV